LNPDEEVELKDLEVTPKDELLLEIQAVSSDDESHHDKDVRLDNLYEVDSDSDSDVEKLQEETAAREATAHIPIEEEDVDVDQEHHKPSSKHVALAIWLGILIDGVPESFVIGILTQRGMSYAFLIGVFLSNFPEALSSSAIMREHGMSKLRVFVMWMSICIMTGIGAAVGALIFGPEVEGAAFYAMKGIEGLAGGAMLVMIAKTMLPEAFAEGGEISGMTALCGFLAALIVRTSAH
jgi:zinc transporter ZupT